MSINVYVSNSAFELSSVIFIDRVEYQRLTIYLYKIIKPSAYSNRVPTFIVLSYYN